MFRFRINDQLELRIYEERHALEVFNAVVANRQHLRRWLPWADRVRTIDDTLTFIHRSLEQFARNDGLQAGIWEAGRYVGGIGMHFVRHDTRRTELGYWLAEAAQGRGIMTRACAAMTHWCFQELSLNRVEIQCARDNHRSRAIPRRLGYVEEGILRETGVLDTGLVDQVVYGMLAREWRMPVEPPITVPARSSTAPG
jgi:ribosomal-protein-serine acetyltransferase